MADTGQRFATSNLGSIGSLLPGIKQPTSQGATNQSTTTSTTTTAQDPTTQSTSVTLPGITSSVSNKVPQTGYAGAVSSGKIKTNIQLPGITTNQTSTISAIDPHEAVQGNIEFEKQEANRVLKETPKLFEQGVRNTWNNTKKAGKWMQSSLYNYMVDEGYRNNAFGVMQSEEAKAKSTQLKTEMNNESLQYRKQIDTAFNAWKAKNIDKGLEKTYDNETIANLIKYGDGKGLLYKTTKMFADNWTILPEIVVTALNPPVGLTLMGSDVFIQESQSGMDEMLENGATYDEAKNGAFWIGMINAGIELCMEQFLGVVGTSSRFIRKSIMKKFTQNVTKEVVERVTKKTLPEILFNMGKGQLKTSISEGTEEILQQIVTNAFVKSVNPDKSLTEGLYESFEGGAWMGLLLPGGSLESLSNDLEHNEKVQEKADREAMEYVNGSQNSDTPPSSTPPSDTDTNTDTSDTTPSNTQNNEESVDEESQIEEEMINDILSDTDEDLGNSRYQKSDSPQSVNEDTVSEKSRTGNIKITPADSTEINNNLNEIKKSLQDLKADTFLQQIKKSILGNEKKSNYITNRINDQKYTLRVSDHNTNAGTSIQHPNNNTSIVIKLAKKSKFKKDNKVDLVEYIYNPESMTPNTMQGIIDGIQNWLKTGDYNDSNFNDRKFSTKKAGGQQQTNTQSGEKHQLNYEEKGYTPGVAGKNEKSISGKEGISIKNLLNGKTIKELAEKYGIKIEVIEGMIEVIENGLKSGYAYGKYVNKLLTLSEQIKESTAPHELLHAIFDMLDPDTKAYLISQVIQTEGWSASQAEEWLADSFSNFFRTGKIESAPKSTWGKIKSFFKKVKNFINGMNRWKSELEEIFTDIIDANGIEDLQNRVNTNSKLEKGRTNMRERIKLRTLRKNMKKKMKDKYQKVYHGSPNDFDTFDSSHMGEGEGNQAHGWGHYVAIDENTSRGYANLKDEFSFIGKGYREVPGVINDRDMMIDYFIGHLQAGEKFEDIKKSRIDYLQDNIDNTYNYWLDLFDKEGVDEYDGIKKEDVLWHKKADQEEIDLINSIDEKDFSHRNFYEVEIPDPVKRDTPTGSNYLDEERYIDEDTIAKFTLELNKLYPDKALDFAIDLDKLKLANGETQVYGGVLYDELDKVLGSDKKASKFLESLGYDGIHYFGGTDGECYVIFNDKNLEIKNHEKYQKIDSDKEYEEAVKSGDKEKALGMLKNRADEAGYKAGEKYKGAGAWSAPSSTVDKKDFRNLDELSKAVEHGYDTNLYAIAQGISNQPDDYFGPMGARYYGYNDITGRQSYLSISDAMESIKSQIDTYGEVKDMPEIEVYRAVPNYSNQIKKYQEILDNYNKAGYFHLSELSKDLIDTYQRFYEMEQKYGDVNKVDDVFKEYIEGKIENLDNDTVKEGMIESGGEWVTPSINYAKEHGKNRFDGKYKILKEKIPADQLRWDGNDIRERGFDDGNNYVVKKGAKNSRKNLEIEYDDNGKLIPLSKRFNEKKSDPRYQKTDNQEYIDNLWNVQFGDNGEKYIVLNGHKYYNDVPKNVHLRKWRGRQFTNNYKFNISNKYNIYLDSLIDLINDKTNEAKISRFIKIDSERLGHIFERHGDFFPDNLIESVNNFDAIVFDPEGKNYEYRFLKKIPGSNDFFKVIVNNKNGGFIITFYEKISGNELAYQKELQKGKGWRSRVKAPFHPFLDEDITKKFGKSSENDIRYQKIAEDSLIALHNLSLDKLVKTTELGGFPMPSIAVTKKGVDHVSYGDITLIMKESTVNPRKAGNRLYQFDAYTPTVPSAVRMIKNTPEADAIIDKIEKETGLNYGRVQQRLEYYEDYPNSYPEFEKYKNLYDEVTEKKLFAGFTPSGKRKYVDYNVENIVKEMKKNKENSYYGTFGKFVAKVGGMDTTLEKLRNIKFDAKANDLWSELNAKYINALEDIYKKYNKDGSDFYRFQDNFEYTYSPNDEKWLKDLQDDSYVGGVPDMTMEDLQKVKGVLKEAVSLPRPYAEAKPERAVLFDEVGAVIVPDQQVDEVKELLKDKGVSVYGYKEGERMDVINKVADDKKLRFQKVEGSEYGYEYDKNGKISNLSFGDNEGFDFNSTFNRSKEDQIKSDENDEKQSPYYKEWMKYNNQNYGDDRMTFMDFILKVGEYMEKQQDIATQEQKNALEDPELIALQLRAVKLAEKEGRVGKIGNKNVSKSVRDKQQAEIDKERESLEKDINDYLHGGTALTQAEQTYEDVSDISSLEQKREATLNREELEKKMKLWRKGKNGERVANKITDPIEKTNKLLSSGDRGEVLGKTPDKVLKRTTPEGQSGIIDSTKDPAKYRRVLAKIRDPKTKTKVKLDDITKETRTLEKVREEQAREKERQKKEKAEAYAEKKKKEYNRNVLMRAFQKLVDMQIFEQYPFLSEEEIKNRYGFTDEEWKKITEQQDLNFPPKGKKGYGEKAIKEFENAVNQEMRSLMEGLTRQNKMKQREAEKNLPEIEGFDVETLLGRDEEKGEAEIQEFEDVSKGDVDTANKRLEESKKNIIEDVKIDKERENNKSEIERIEKLLKKNKTDRTVRGAVKNFSTNILTPVSTRIKKISTKIHQEIMDYFQRKEIKTNERLKAIDPFIKTLGKLRKKNPVRFMEIRVNLANRNIGYVNGLLKEYGVTVPTELLDKIYKEAEDVGLNINYLGNYYPISVKAPKAFLEEMMKIDEGDMVSKIEKRIQEESEKKGGPLEEEEVTAIINEVIMGNDKGPDVNVGNSHLKQRNTKLKRTEKMLEYCDDPISTLISYIEGMTQSIERAKFLGQSRTGQVKELASYVYNDKNNLTPEQQDELMELLKSVFNDESPNKFVQSWRDIATLTTLGSPSSTLTQLGDLSFSVYENGWKNTLKAVWDMLLKRKAFNLEDMGITNRGEEYTNINSQKNLLQKAIHNVFKLTFFSSFDTFGKSAYIQSTWRKRQKRAKQGEKGDKQFRKDLMRRTDSEYMVDKIINDLRNGVFSQEVSLMMFMKLSNIQPLTKAQMPKTYLDNPNGRLFYQFKTFGIKQLDYILSEFNEQMKGWKNKSVAEKYKSVAQIASMVFTMTLLGMGADELKDLTMRRRSNSMILRWLYGENVGSEQIWEKIEDNALKLFGLSRYTVMSMKTDPVDAITNLFTTLPATNIIAYPFKDIRKAFKDDGSINRGSASSWQLIPLIGKYRYWIYGGGHDKQMSELGGGSSSSKSSGGSRWSGGGSTKKKSSSGSRRGKA